MAQGKEPSTGGDTELAGQPDDVLADGVAAPGAAALAGAYTALLAREIRVSAPVDESTSAAGADLPEQPAEESAPPPLYRIVEAMLFIGGPPLTAARAAEAVRGLSAEQLQQAVEELNRDYRRQGRPYRVQARAQGYDLTLLSRYRGVVDRLYGSAREARLSPAALDVLALVAYRQPVTRQEVESLRGVDSAGPLRQLVRLGLACVQRGGPDSGEVSYTTTPRFLKLFSLRNLDDLPRTVDLQKM
jgi:segregation and condensation protein B